MYDLPYYKDEDRDALTQFMRDHPFAFICGCDRDHKPVATQVPVFVDEREGTLYLTGHMMRRTEHHVSLEQNPNVLAVFTGASTYVSATWYSNPHQASTWNYMSVHAAGTIRFTSEDELMNVLHKTTNHFENNNPRSTTALQNLPTDYVQKLIKAIVGFEVKVTSLRHVFKLSQDRDEESHRNIRAKLAEGNADARFIADEMKKRSSALFEK